MVNGFSYHPSFLTPNEHDALHAAIAALSFREDTFRGVVMRRTIVCYGNDYSAKHRSARNPAPPIPSYLEPVRDRAAMIAGLVPSHLTQAIIWKYPPKAGIGWHVDHKDYGPVICGVSLATPAVLRLKRDSEQHRFVIEPGSLYVLRDEARYDWMHKTEGNRDERFSITFRSMR
jgi:alkylated DNA repair protein (DNA oxidative demethylase)